MKRTYTRQLKCSTEGCGECGHWTFDTQKEMASHYDRVKTYACLRHRTPEEVLGLNNLHTETTIKCKQLGYGRFWQVPQQEGTDKCISGFQHGNGYMAYAEDFPEGTIIKITTEVILP